MLNRANALVGDGQKPNPEKNILGNKYSRYTSMPSFSFVAHV